MKKALQIIASAAIALAALASCNKEQFKENTPAAGEAIQVSVNGLIGDFTPADATKATAGSVVRITWEQGDKVYVYDGTDDPIGTLTVTPDEKNASYALLSGEITASSASPAPTKLTLVYVKGETEAPAIAGGKISIDLSTQDQAEVPFVLYSTIDYDASNLAKSEEYISFSFATSVMTVNCTDLPTNEGSKIDITKAEIDGVSTKCELTVTGSGVTVAGASKGTITRSEMAEPSVFTQSDSRGSFILALAADPETPAARNILVYQGSKVYGAPFTSATLAGNKSYNTVYQLGEYVAPPAGILSGVFSVADGKTVHFSKGNLYCNRTSSTSNDWTWHFYDNQYGYNSLNSKCNEERYREASEGDTEIDLFTWGYSISTSLLPAGNKYVEDHTTEGDLQLVSSEGGDDWGVAYCESNAITVGTWRTLTTAEWQYLFYTRLVNGDTGEGKSYQRATINSDVNDGVYGAILYPDDYTSQTEATSYTSDQWTSMEKAGCVFLPAAGTRNDSDVENVGFCGYYWSSSAPEEDYAWCVYILSSYVSPESGGSRSTGYSVRLVTEASDGYAPKAPEVLVESISLSETELELMEGGNKSLTVTFTPEDATKKDVFWSSDNTAVATVDQTGKVSAVSVGTATITAVAGGLAKASCKVTVTGLSNNVIIYKAAEMLIESDPDDDETPGIHTNAFGENAIKSHEFEIENGVGTITFDGDVTSIGQMAFYGCGITYVGIPASVKEIGSMAFAGCEALEQVYIAYGSELETIGGTAFYGSGLKSFNIPASVTEITLAFAECENLTTVTFADNSSLETIGVGAFNYCTKLTSITIPASVKEICEAAFQQCFELSTVTFAEGSQLSTIGEDAFYKSGLKSFNIPASVTEITGAFNECINLTTVTFADNSSLETIGQEAFYDCTKLTSVTIPASVKGICEAAFQQCFELSTVTFAEGSQLSTIGEGAFYDCTKLTSVNIPASVTEICDMAFQQCNNLTTVTFAEGSQLSTIGEWAFFMNGLTAINIPVSVTDIGEYSFFNCYNLTSVKVNWVDEIPSIKNISVFGVNAGDEPSRTLYVPSGKAGMYNADNGWDCFEAITDETE